MIELMNLKFVLDTSADPQLKEMVDANREADKALQDQHNWLVDQSEKIAKKRKDLNDKFWDNLIPKLIAQDKLPKDFQLRGDVMITFGNHQSYELFTMKRPQMINLP